MRISETKGNVSVEEEDGWVGLRLSQDLTLTRRASKRGE
jgi:hypothetical protein